MVALERHIGRPLLGIAVQEADPFCVPLAILAQRLAVFAEDRADNSLVHGFELAAVIVERGSEPRPGIGNGQDLLPRGVDDEA